jgi:ureidoacrylate peracid hydrolase
MDLLELIDPGSTALVVIDAQNDFVHPRGKSGLLGRDLETFPAALASINRLLGEARQAGVDCLFVRVEHGPRVDMAPYRAKYEPRGMYETDTLCHEGSWGAQFIDALSGPLPGDRAFVKHGYDPFYVAEFEAAVGERDRRSLIVVGFVTNLCVAATVASAFERGLFPIVPVDCVAASNPDAARVTLDSIRNFYGVLCDSAEVIDGWRTLSASREMADTAKV